MKKFFLKTVLLMISVSSYSQVGIGTTSPHSSSILDLTSTDKAFLLPRVADTTAIATPTNGMLIYSTSQKCFKGYQDGWVDVTPCTTYNTTAMTFGTVTYQGVSLINSQGIGYNGENVPSASTITVEVTVTEATPYNFTANDPTSGLTYSASGNFTAPGTYSVVLQNNGALIPWNTYGILPMVLSGASNSISLVPRIDVKTIPASETAIVDVAYGSQIWMDRNLGARRAATAQNDVLSYGNHYQWGRPSDGHEISIINGATLVAGRGLQNSTTVIATTNTPGHSNFILNTTTPWDWVSDNNNNRWNTATQGPCPSGYRLPTASEYQSYDTSLGLNNATDLYNSPLKLPSSGVRSNANNTLANLGSGGYYYTSSPLPGSANASVFSAYLSFANVNSLQRAVGANVRCIKN